MKNVGVTGWMIMTHLWLYFLFSDHLCLINTDEMLRLNRSEHLEAITDMLSWVTDPLLNLTLESDFVISPQKAVVC